MTIRNRLTLISSLTFGVVFTLAAFAVYYTFHVTSERIIFSELQKTGLLSAMFYLEEDELSAREHNRIRTDFEVEMQQTDVKVYDSTNRVRYGNGHSMEQVVPAALQRIRDEGRVRFKTGGYYYYGLYYPDNQGDFVVVVATSNVFFASQSNQLLLMMGIALAVGLLTIFLLSYWLSRIAYRPISAVIHQVNQLQADNLETALTLPKTKDELHELVSTFNGLLLRLADTFVIQKNFINYVSHEFKTPLASITGNLEVFAQRDRSPAEYKEVSQTVLAQVSQLERIFNNLMILAGLRNNPADNTAYRIDELLWNVLDRIFDKWPEAKPLLRVEVLVPNPDKLLAKGNGNQMQMAVYNLIDNAVKYANGHPVVVTLSQQGKWLQLTVQDNGTGITPEELKHVHQPFYRGSNVGNTKGSGIGLSLAVLICKQNGVSFSLASEIGRGTTVTLGFSQL
ncbi:HAMP domain-containing histidine kinase [Parapedobacter sp. ISTM3]|uniref:HAMP domain-containing sensor histidine kinase n=1 Tax=Parapedobacter sp. ISTM3 TaxID=2800130 RepID=UPI0019073710|nr:HAMP domain-containing sensor histidine kinase [Parapedobacter sp. ISTM3]MBK1442100.1 HAMP domain-containing histidine kinase [Parapedobacter sp. ISTM3]